MILVTVGNNTARKKVTVSPETTLRTILEDNEINYTVGTMHLDGSALQAGDLDKTLAEFGITDKCYLLNVVKSDNA